MAVESADISWYSSVEFLKMRMGNQLLDRWDSVWGILLENRFEPTEAKRIAQSPLRFRFSISQIT